jgi:anti-sigma B factor antagonist
MEVTVEPRQGQSAVVRLKGRLDLLTAAEVKQQLSEIVKSGHSQLVVDMTSVSFLDSSGLGALIGGLKAARVAGGDLRLAGAGEQVRYILEISTLERVLRPYSTVEEALSGYS